MNPIALTIIFVLQLKFNLIRSFQKPLILQPLRRINNHKTHKAVISDVNMASSFLSQRILRTERPYIEDVLDKYSDLPNITKLALGSSYWGPPQTALESIHNDLFHISTHKYSNILGMDELRDEIKRRLLLASGGNFPTNDNEVVITAGANQAMINIALSLCDPEDDIVILSPYYFSHLLAFQLAGAKVHTCSFDASTLAPRWDQLASLMEEHQPKAVS